MALLKDNHLICLNCGRNAGSLRIYLQQLFQKAGMPEAARQFEIARIGSPDKVALIQAVGVGRVDLEIDIADTTAADLINGQVSKSIWSNIKSGAAEAVRAITRQDQRLEQVRQAQKGTVTVSINVPKGDVSTAKDGLDHLAEEVTEDEDAEGFTIHLRNGNTIKSDEVSVKKAVRLEAAANSVSVFQAWDAMEGYLDELAKSGQLKA